MEMGRKNPRQWRAAHHWRGDVSCTSAASSSQDAPPCYRKSQWKCANLMVTTGEHVALRCGPGVRNQRFEAGEEVNASIAQPATIGGVRVVQ